MASRFQLDPEGYCPANDHPRWNQSVYFNFYDPASRIGCFIRIGILENQRETNSWFLFFRDGRPLFARCNMNLPYTDQRIGTTGLDVAGMRVEALVPLSKARIRFADPTFEVDLLWDAMLPMHDAIRASMSGDDDAFAKEMMFIHMEGPCQVSGRIRVRSEPWTEIAGTGFRDLAVGPRNWDYLQHYRLAWPIFDDGMSIVATHGVSVAGEDAYIKMVGKRGRWLGVADIVDRNVYEPDEMTIRSMDWSVTDVEGDCHAFTAKRLFGWAFPLDSFVLTEHLMEYRRADGVAGYGLAECGFRFPWGGNGEPPVSITKGEDNGQASAARAHQPDAGARS